MSSTALTASTPLDAETGNGVATVENSTAPASPGSPEASAAPATPTTPAEAYRGFSIASFVLGIASVVSGWTLFAPVVGLVLGVIALRRGTSERTFALWGVWLNGIMLGFAVLLVTIGLVAFGIAGAFTLPFWAL